MKTYVCERRMPPHLDILSGQMTLTLVLKKGFTSRNIYVKYERFTTYHSKTMVNVKVFAEKQTDRPKTICTRSIYAGT